MHGPETVRILRKEMHFKGVIIGVQYDRKTTNELSIKFLVMSVIAGVTGNALPADVTTFLESGVNEVIIKPLTKLKLVESLLAWKGKEGELFLSEY